MNPTLKTLMRGAAVAAAAMSPGFVGADDGVGFPAQSAEQATPEKTWNFRVFLDDQEIGYHEFRVLPKAGGQRVEIKAEFAVKFLFITAYRYRHQNEEIWRDGCLTAIRSSTDNNGEQLEVSGTLSQQGFRLGTGQAESLLPTDCLQSFAYWNRDIVHASHLLNAQTGELVAVDVLDRGPETIEVAGRAVDVRRYSITMEGDPIELWYHAEDGAWLALEAPAGGRVLRYEPRDLPFKVGADGHLVLD
ncbi:MAG: DUF6134 family protein [Xanthomonadales bacterium]|nr:DUF6134 family protein [Xanthomonadales bacterium]